ncbi:MAG: hypothetical protein IJD81_00960 [Oscillospiraceae bacterium]|nr:hypothetical protein [Oscillospiraceae bacterium]
MKCKKAPILLVLAAALLLCLAGCELPKFVKAEDYYVYEADAYHPVKRLTTVVTAEDIAMLEEYPDLVRLDLTGSTCYPEMLEYVLAHPDVKVIYNVEIMGKQYPRETVSINLSNLTSTQVKETAQLLRHFPDLRYVEVMKDDGTCALSYEDVKTLQDAVPNVSIHYLFELFGQQISLGDTKLEFVNTMIGDAGLEEIRNAIKKMPQLKTIRLDNCGTTSEAMDKLRKDYPNLSVHWRVWFGKYTCMTDETMLRLTNGLKNEHIGEMKYLTEAVYVDLGHNEYLSDLSFFEYMPKVKVLILSGTAVNDVTHLKNLKQLEWLELVFCDYLKDISPLEGCTGLKYLNISITRVSQLDALMKLPLERMVALQMGQLAQSEREAFAEAQPDCLRVWWGTQPYGYGWRYSDQGYTFYKYYAEMRDIFKYDDKYFYNGRYYNTKRLPAA